MRTMRAAKSAALVGRPGPRFALPSYFSTISLRCHRSRASGVMMVATSASTLLPNSLPLPRGDAAVGHRSAIAVFRVVRAESDSPRVDNR